MSLNLSKPKIAIIASAAFVGGVLFASSMDWTKIVGAQIRGTTGKPIANVSSSLMDQQNSFVAVAEHVTPAVVSIDGEAWLATREGDLFKRLESGDHRAVFGDVVRRLPDPLADHGQAIRRIGGRVEQHCADGRRTRIAPRAPVGEEEQFVPQRHGTRMALQLSQYATREPPDRRISSASVAGIVRWQAPQVTPVSRAAPDPLLRARRSA